MLPLLHAGCCATDCNQTTKAGCDQISKPTSSSESPCPFHRTHFPLAPFPLHITPLHTHRPPCMHPRYRPKRGKTDTTRKLLASMYGGSSALLDGDDGESAVPGGRLPTPHPHSRDKPNPPSTHPSAHPSAHPPPSLPPPSTASCPIPLHTTAYHCIPLHTTACHCMPLHAVACHCMPLHAIACHCMPLQPRHITTVAAAATPADSF